jgi:hypothetical protein
VEIVSDENLDERGLGPYQL